MRRMKDEYFAAIESFIDRYREEAGISPTLSEIADGTGIPRSTVPRYLAVMRESGVLDYSGHRGITTRRDRAAEEGIRVPVLGSVSCGLPKLAEENIEEYVTLPQALFGRGEMYILRASGESMIEAGIEDGDLVLIRVQSTAERGKIVVALVGDEATLKRYYPEPERRRVRLHPENESMEDIYVPSCVIQGVAVMLLRDLETR